MNVKVVNLSDLDMGCISTDRIFNTCQDCDRVDYCHLPESQAGRIVLKEQKVKKLSLQLKQARKDLKDEIGE